MVRARTSGDQVTRHTEGQVAETQVTSSVGRTPVAPTILSTRTLHPGKPKAVSLAVCGGYSCIRTPFVWVIRTNVPWTYHITRVQPLSRMFGNTHTPRTCSWRLSKRTRLSTSWTSSSFMDNEQLLRRVPPKGANNGTTIKWTNN